MFFQHYLVKGVVIERKGKGAVGQMNKFLEICSIAINKKNILSFKNEVYIACGLS